MAGRHVPCTHGELMHMSMTENGNILLVKIGHYLFGQIGLSIHHIEVSMTENRDMLLIRLQC